MPHEHQPRKTKQQWNFSPGTQDLLSRMITMENFWAQMTVIVLKTQLSQLHILLDKIMNVFTNFKQAAWQQSPKLHPLVTGAVERSLSLAYLHEAEPATALGHSEMSLEKVVITIPKFQVRGRVQSSIVCINTRYRCSDHRGSPKMP